MAKSCMCMMPREREREMAIKVSPLTTVHWLMMNEPAIFYGFSMLFVSLLLGMLLLTMFFTHFALNALHVICYMTHCYIRLWWCFAYICAHLRPFA
jgi:hypothetical protein